MIAERFAALKSGSLGISASRDPQNRLSSVDGTPDRRIRIEGLPSKPVDRDRRKHLTADDIRDDHVLGFFFESDLNRQAPVRFHP